AICRSYGLTAVQTDQWAADALRDIGRRHGLTVYDRHVTAALKMERFETLRTKITEGDFELPPDPALRADLLSARKRVTQNGISIELRRTSDGRHADYAMALAFMNWDHISDPKVPIVGPQPGTREWNEMQQGEWKERAILASIRRTQRETGQQAAARLLAQKHQRWR